MNFTPVDGPVYSRLVWYAYSYSYVAVCTQMYPSPVTSLSYTHGACYLLHTLMKTKCLLSVCLCKVTHPRLTSLTYVPSFH